MTANEKFNNIVLCECKINDNVYIETEHLKIYGRVKSYDILEGWIELKVTDNESVKIKGTDVLNCELYNKDRIEMDKFQTEKFLDLFAFKYKIPFEAFKRDAEKKHLAISYIYKIWNKLLANEKDRLLSIFMLDKEGMEFILTKLNHQFLIIDGQKKQIDRLNKIIQDLIQDLTLTDTYQN